MKPLRRLALAFVLVAPFVAAQEPLSLAGTWTLAAADDLKPDGTRVPAYGPNPQGLLVFLADGRYSLQIYRSDRVPFASGNKRQGTPAEYQAASLGMSSHFGRYVVDAAHATLTFQIEHASFANWNGTSQKRPFELTGDELSYRVPAAPDGNVPVSLWRRVRP
jgi:Lipocalin-like domain